MALAEYRRKRDFRVTAEPRGGRVASHKGLAFVIQKHAASHLHYDFRLELDGVLKSWAVPKGPSLDPSQKRLAMHVEDHPLEYGSFEGIIPEGEYGGGTVMVWDRGTWEPVGDPNSSYRDGAIKFVLHGEKLEGRWMLVRRGGKRGDPNERHWFLFKERDEFANPTVDVEAAMPLSVATGRDLDEIAGDADRVWGPGGEKTNGRKQRTKSARKPRQKSRAKSLSPATAAKSKGRSAKFPNRSAIEQALRELAPKRARLPRTATVELATLAKTAPAGDDWLHETKFDGYRMLCRIDDGRATMISRNGKDWTAKFPVLTAAAAELPVTNAMLDGEVVVLQPDGQTSFQALQNTFQTGNSDGLLYYAFDLLYLNGHDVRALAIEDRKTLLRLVIPGGSRGKLRFSDHVVGNGPEIFDHAARMHLEGIISKRRSRPYVSGRGVDWLKVKCSLRDEFVVGGFTPPSGARSHFGALLLGYFDAKHRFVYAGRVGTGFDDRALAVLHRKLTSLAQPRSPFVNLSGATGPARKVTWVKPSIVAQIAFSNWTEDRYLRHPAFLGLREDKAAAEVVREDPLSLRQAAQSAHKKERLKEKTANHSARHAAEVANGHSVASETAGVRLSHPDKVLYPADGITKLDLARYYETVAEWMLPHVANRLLALVRCPAGSGQKCFFQKHPGEGTPDLLERVKVTEKQKTEDYLVVKDLPGLIALVQMGVLELHVWGSRADDYERPDRLIFDLDPDPSVDWLQVVAAARDVRMLLEDLDLRSFVKTTGGKGLHVVVPIRRRTSWPVAKAFCRAVADALVIAAPDRYIATMSKAARKGKIFVDYLRNDRGSTAIAPYSTRARTGATVSAPISWDELNGRLKPDHFNIRNLPARLLKLKHDPWADMAGMNQSLTKSLLRKLSGR